MSSTPLGNTLAFYLTLVVILAQFTGGPAGGFLTDSETFANNRLAAADFGNANNAGSSAHGNDWNKGKPGHGNVPGSAPGSTGGKYGNTKSPGPNKERRGSSSESENDNDPDQGDLASLAARVTIAGPMESAPQRVQVAQTPEDPASTDFEPLQRRSP